MTLAKRPKRQTHRQERAAYVKSARLRPRGATHDRAAKLPARKIGEVERIEIRRLKALQCRLASQSYRQIAAACGVSVETAYHDVMTEMSITMNLKDIVREDAREFILAQVDRYLSKIDRLAMHGDIQAQHQAERWLTLKARVQGVLAPDVIIPATGGGFRRFADLPEDALRAKIAGIQGALADSTLAPIDWTAYEKADGSNGHGDAPMKANGSGGNGA